MKPVSKSVCLHVQLSAQPVNIVISCHGIWKWHGIWLFLQGAFLLLDSFKTAKMIYFFFLLCSSAANQNNRTFAGIIFYIFVFSTIYGAAAVGDQHCSRKKITKSSAYSRLPFCNQSYIQYYRLWVADLTCTVWSAYQYASTLTMHTSLHHFSKHLHNLHKKHWWHQ